MKYERKQYVDQLIHKKDNGRVQYIGIEDFLLNENYISR